QLLYDNHLYSNKIKYGLGGVFVKSNDNTINSDDS
ncbi:unnamed protein product, partial [Rotaria sordida]